MWFKPACVSLRKFEGTPEQWFITGVFIGFLGTFFDNIYWTIAWTMTYLGHPMASDITQYGVFSNIPFRQLLGITAAYCHVRSALEYKKEGKHVGLVNYLLVLSIVLGFVYSIGLIILKYS